MQKSQFPGRYEWKSVHVVKQAIRHHKTKEWGTRTQADPDLGFFVSLTQDLLLLAFGNRIILLVKSDLLDSSLNSGLFHLPLWSKPAHAVYYQF